jgi:ElaA protein
VTPSINWQWRAFDELSTRQLYALIAVREAVFIVEQNCAYQDADGLDAKAMHFIGWDQDTVATYLRVFAPGEKFAEASIGRVLTAATHRGLGLGKVAMRLAVQYIDEHHANASTRISAQAHLVRFYNEFGFSKVSDEYFEDGIPHIAMLRQPRGV